MGFYTNLYCLFIMSIVYLDIHLYYRKKWHEFKSCTFNSLIFWWRFTKKWSPYVALQKTKQCCWWIFAKCTTCSNSKWRKNSLELRYVFLSVSHWCHYKVMRFKKRYEDHYFDKFWMICIFHAFSWKLISTKSWGWVLFSSTNGCLGSLEPFLF